MRTYYVHPKLDDGYRRIWLPFLIFFIFLLLSAAAYAYYALTRELPVGSIEMHENLVTPTEGVQIAWPEQGTAAIGTLDSGLLATSTKEELPRPIASLTKVITALAVLEKAPMQPGETGISITFNAEDELSYNEYLAKLGTVTNVAAGEKINQYQALQAMLLPSSNNMSDTLVKRVFGSMEAYKLYANDMLQRYGLSKTRVDDASGFSPNSVSTPSEMITIGQKALDHPVIAEIVKQPNAEIPLSGVVPNYNGLLSVEGVNGIKPGVTDEAGWCLLFSATQQTETGQELTFIGVLLGEDDPSELIDASEKLLTMAKSNVQQVEVVRGGSTVGVYKTPWGDETDLVAQDSLWAHTIKGRMPETVAEFTEPPVTVRANQTLASIRMPRNSSKSVNVVTLSDSKTPSLLWRLSRPLQQYGLLR